MIRKNLLKLIFSGAYLWRWNDKLRPVELSEIEKQAHKMLVACALWHASSINMTLEERTNLEHRIIEGALFDYFYRLIITDIKPPVFYRIKNNRDHYLQLTSYALGKLEPILFPLGDFWERLKIWHMEDSDSLERRILRVAHLYASRWEFQLIRPQNPFDEEMDGIAASFENELNTFKDLPAVMHLLDPQHALGKIANLCGQLRFQIRWTQAPRIPSTSVLGHMFIVASLAWFFSMDIKAGKARLCNNFFSGLFHDFPEVLTRDIISPVKQSSYGLSQLIKEYEEEELSRRVLLPLKKSGYDKFAERIGYYLGLQTGSEFTDCCVINEKIKILNGFADIEAHDTDALDPKDGKLLKICDLLAAFLEADSSIKNGVATPELMEGRIRLKKLLEKQSEQIHLDALLADFE